MKHKKNMVTKSGVKSVRDKSSGTATKKESGSEKVALYIEMACEYSKLGVLVLMLRKKLIDLEAEFTPEEKQIVLTFIKDLDVAKLMS